MLLRMPQMPQVKTLSPVIRNYGINLGAPYRVIHLSPSESGLSRLSLRDQPCVRNLHCVCVCVCVGGGGGSELL